MGCDAPVGWNRAEEEHRHQWEQRGYRVNLSPDPYTCLRCGSEVKREMADTHDEWHDKLDRHSHRTPKF